MLSVGREINIESKHLLCRKCAWQGRGAELSTGLVRVSHSDIYVYVYRCPVCESFELASKGKLLEFRAVTAAMPDSIEQNADDPRQSAELRRRN